MADTSIGISAEMITHTGTVGLVKQSDSITDISFDILSLQALFLVPRQVPASSEVASASLIGN